MKDQQVPVTRLSWRALLYGIAAVLKHSSVAGWEERGTHLYDTEVLQIVVEFGAHLSMTYILLAYKYLGPLHKV